jgi:class 3 adenylate cyclase
VEKEHYQERLLAIVLLDLIGSTDFVRRVGAMKAAEWLQYHDRLSRSMLYKFNGREIDRSDGFLLSFERPIDALNFALNYQKTIPAKTHLNARIGIHWGQVIEVTQHELLVLSGAKPIELEGLSKNLAARTMSMCRAGQVLLTKQAFQVIKGRANPHTPKGTRYACVGLYQFKGVRQPQTIYAVGVTIESLQPPEGNEKAKRLGGPGKIKSKARHRRLKEWAWWILWRSFWLSLGYIICLLYPFIKQWIKEWWNE